MADKKNEGLDVFDTALLPAAGAAGGLLLGRKFAKKFLHVKGKTFPYVKAGSKIGEGSERFSRPGAAVENAAIGAMRHPRTTLAAVGAAMGAGVDQSLPRRKK